MLALASVVIGPARAGAGAGARAGAPTADQAGVVVDLGNGTVRRVGITLGGTLSGLEALQRAGFAPVVRGYGSLGAAVCALQVGDTVLGCPADSSCLTCAAPNYWVYFRAPAGATAFAQSRAGAGATTVHDGDVEGWRWGHGSAPAWSPLDTFFPPPTATTAPATTTTVPVAPTTTRPTTTSPTPTSLATTTTTAPTSAAQGGATTTTTGTAPGDGTTPTGTPLPAAATPTPGSAPAVTPARVHGAPAGGRTVAADAARASGPPVVRTARSAGVVAALPIVVFCAVAAGFGAAIVVARRRRATL